MPEDTQVNVEAVQAAETGNDNAEQPEVSAPSPDAETSETSTDNGDSPEAKLALIEEIEAKHRPKAQQDSPPAKTAENQTTDEVEPEAPGAKTDEQPKADKADEDSEALKSPEWNKVLSLVPKEGRKAMREALQPFFKHEKAQRDELTRLGGLIGRIRTRVGDEGVENSIRLIESWHEGSEAAEKMLVELLTDLRTRRGTVLHSPDLVNRHKQVEQQLADNLLTPEEAQTRRAELLELEQARAGKKQSDAKVEQTRAQTEEARREAVINERMQAMDNWEKGVQKQDADYPKIKGFVEAEALRLTELRQGRQQSLLSPAQMVEILQESLATVKERLKGMLPQPKPVKPVNGGGSSLNSRPAPKNETEKFNQTVDALEARYRR